jgi:hypothetical protein
VGNAGTGEERSGQQATGTGHRDLLLLDGIIAKQIDDLQIDDLYATDPIA